MADCPERGVEVDLPAVVEVGELTDDGTCGRKREVVDADAVLLEPASELEEDRGE